MKKILLACLSVGIVIIGLQYLNVEQVIRTDLPQELERPSYFGEAQWQRILSRGGDITPTKMQTARNNVVQETEKLLATENQKDAGLRGWSTIGPCNIGGRVRAIGLQPTPQGGEIIWVGAAGGGLWRSTDSGSSYTVIDDIDLSLAITSISIDPLDPNNIYVSTGEGFSLQTIGLPGAGIFRSTDGGNSFDLLPATANDEFYWVNKVVADPHVAKHLYAVVLDFNQSGTVFGEPFNGGGILKESFDSGDTWTDVFTDDLLTDIDIHPTNPNVQVVSGHGTVRVRDGNNWREQTGSGPDDISVFSGRIEIAMSAIDDQIMYALVNDEVLDGLAIIYKSIDGGDDWDQVSANSSIFSSANFGNYSNTIWVDPLDDNQETIYLGGVDLWKSTDSGQTFTRISDWRVHNSFTNLGVTEGIQLHADQHIIMPSLTYGKNNPKVFIGNDGGIQKADDIAIANANVSPTSGWDNLTGNMCTVQFYRGDVSSGGQFAGGAQDNGTLLKDNNIYSVDNDWTHPITGDGSDVYFRTEDIIYATTNFNSLHKSTDGGSTFMVVADIEFDSSFLIGPSAYDKNGDPDLVYLGGERLWLYDDSDGSLSLKKNLLPVVRRISTIDLDDNLVILGYENGVVEFSSNGGNSWSGDITSVGALTPPNSFITDIHIAQSNSLGITAYVTFGGYRSDQVFELQITLSNGSISWKDVSLDFDMQVNTVTTHPSNANWLYVGTDVGIFSSEDGGKNWSVTPLLQSNDPIYNNDSPFYVEVQELFWDFENVNGVYHLCAATFGRGMLRSDYALALGSYVDQAHGGNQVGTETLPFKTFLPALGIAENVGTPVIFLEGGDYDEYSSNTLLRERVLIKSEASSSAIIK